MKQSYILPLVAEQEEQACVSTNVAASYSDYTFSFKVSLDLKIFLLQSMYIYILSSI
jgi:hypothetical protein